MSGSGQGPRPDWLDDLLRREAQVDTDRPGDTAFLIRLKTIPDRHARPGVPAVRHRKAWWGDLAPLFRPARLAGQAGILALVLMSGVYVGAQQASGSQTTAELDLSEYLMTDDGFEDLP